MRLATDRGGGDATLLRRGNAAVPGRSEQVARGVQRAGGDSRLVIAPGRAAPAHAGEARRVRLAVASENHLASSGAATAVPQVEQIVGSDAPGGPLDPLRLLAGWTAEAIEGGRAAVLPPEKRARLLALGTRLGLRPFDSHLVIAIVQDGVRSGGSAGEVPRRLGLLRAGKARESQGRGVGELGIALQLSAAALLAVGLMSVVIGWIVGG